MYSRLAACDSPTELHERGLRKRGGHLVDWGGGGGGAGGGRGMGAGGWCLPRYVRDRYPSLRLWEGVHRGVVRSVGRGAATDRLRQISPASISSPPHSLPSLR